jgi:ElaB/YqjD/DUF883 family membrane-anchored ribosome-binding protein
MAETNEIRNEVTTEAERSAEEIRENILAKQEDITESVEEISERIEQKLDWREYVGQSPYLALGIAAGLGFLASGMLPGRPTAVERITGTIGEEVGNVISGLLRGPAKSALKLSLWGLASTMALGFAKKAAYDAILGGGSGEGSSPRRGSTPQPEAAIGQTTANR